MEPYTPSGKRAISLVALFALVIGTAFAQTQPVGGSCRVSGVPLQVRAEGLTERMGDIQLQCSGSNPGAVLAGNFTIFLPVSITNRVDSNNYTSDAVLWVDY